MVLKAEVEAQLLKAARQIETLQSQNRKLKRNNQQQLIDINKEKATSTSLIDQNTLFIETTIEAARLHGDVTFTFADQEPLRAISALLKPVSMYWSSKLSGKFADDTKIVSLTDADVGDLLHRDLHTRRRRHENSPESRQVVA